MIELAESLGEVGAIQVQVERCEGLTVFFVSRRASAGGWVLTEAGDAPALESVPTRRALGILRRLADSPASRPVPASPGFARSTSGSRARTGRAPSAFAPGRRSGWWRISTCTSR